LAQGLGRALERRDLTEDNPVFRDAIFGARGSAGNRKGNDWCEQDQRSMIHRRYSLVWDSATYSHCLRMVLPKVKHLPITENRYLGTEHFPITCVVLSDIIRNDILLSAVADTVGCAQKRKKVAQ
jgi:hypothetical protein